MARTINTLAAWMAVVLSICARAQKPYPDFSSPSDKRAAVSDSVAAAWEQINIGRLLRTKPDADTDPIGYWRWYDSVATRIREEGLRLSERYPHDVRRWQWLLNTINFPPAHYADYGQAAAMWQRGTGWYARVDTVRRARAQAFWQRRYPALRAEFFAASESDVSPTQRAALVFAELQQDIVTADGALHRHERGDPLETIPARVLAYAHMPANHAVQLAQWLMPILSRYDTAQRYPFLLAAQASQDKDLHAWAAQEIQFTYGATPFRLHGITLDGRPFDLSRYAGHVIVVDFWSTTCGGCIASIPKLKALYDEYHAQGVTFVSVALEFTPDRIKQVRAIVARHAVPWPHIVTTKRTEQLMQQYGILGVPKYFVVGRRGHVISDGALWIEDLEAAITRGLTN